MKYGLHHLSIFKILNFLLYSQMTENNQLIKKHLLKEKKLLLLLLNQYTVYRSG